MGGKQIGERPIHPVARYEEFDRLADQYNDGKITLQALKASYFLRTGVRPVEKVAEEK